MRKVTYDSLETTSCNLQTIVDTLSLLVIAIESAKPTRSEIIGCLSVVLHSISEFKDELDGSIEDINSTEVFE